MMPKVTVGIPFFNNQDTLADAIQSVLNQTYTNFQLLLANDGSTDGSLKVVESFRDPRIRLIDDGINRGFAGRLNYITQYTETDFLFRMDADDVLCQDRLMAQMEYLLADPKLDLVSSFIWVTDLKGNVEGLLRSSGNSDVTSADVLLKRGGVAHATIGGRTEWFRSNPYREDLKRTEDIELWIRTLDRTRHMLVPKPLYYYRVDKNVNLQSYRKSRQELRGITLEYGPQKIGRMATIKLILRYYLEEAAMIGAVFSRKSHRIVGRRSVSVSQDHLEAANQGYLDAVRSRAE